MENPTSLWEIVAGRWPIMAVAVAAVALTLIVPRLQNVILLWKIPTVGTELGSKEKQRMAYLTSARKLYNDGYKKIKAGVFNGAFKVITSKKSPTIVLSPKFLPELKKIPDNIVSMDAAVDESMEAKYTKIDTYVPIVPHTIKADLTPSLTRLNPLLSQEVREVLDQELPTSKGWTEINIHKALLRIVAMVSGRIFIGPELCRKEEYVDSSINYTMEVVTAQRAVQQLRPWMRPFIASRLPFVKKLDQRIQEANAFLEPVVQRRKQLAADPDAEKPDDMLQWLMDSQSKFPDKNSQNLAKVQLGISFAAIHTTTLTATNAFYSLVALPDFIPELREEITQALSENDGVYTSNALQSMKKMDSFLKEVLRVYPATMASFQRKVLKPFTLSNGQVIPAGVIIEVPAVAVNSDHEVFPHPDKFDPLRFYHLRQQAKEEGSVEGAAQNQFVSIGQNGLTFGYGRHACPGRFFAANEIKMILANTIMKYDFKLAGGQTERYPNMEFAHMSIPDPEKTILIKSRV